MLVLEDDGGRAALLAGDVQQERLAKLGVYRREDRAWLPHLTVARWRWKAFAGSGLSRRRYERRSVRRGCLPVVPARHPDGARYNVLEWPSL